MAWPPLPSTAPPEKQNSLVHFIEWDPPPFRSALLLGMRQVSPLQLRVRALERPVRGAVSRGLPVRRSVQPNPPGFVADGYEGGGGGAAVQARAAQAGIFPAEPRVRQLRPRGNLVDLLRHTLSKWRAPRSPSCVVSTLLTRRGVLFPCYIRRLLSGNRRLDVLALEAYRLYAVAVAGAGSVASCPVIFFCAFCI